MAAMIGSAQLGKNPERLDIPLLCAPSFPRPVRRLTLFLNLDVRTVSSPKQQTAASEACRTLESELRGKNGDLEQLVAEVREESRKAVEVARQAGAGKAGLSDLEVNERPARRTGASVFTDLL